MTNYAYIVLVIGIVFLFVGIYSLFNKKFSDKFEKFDFSNDGQTKESDNNIDEYAKYHMRGLRVIIAGVGFIIIALFWLL